MLQLAFKLMLYGFAGTFSALAVLYASIKIISKIFPSRDQ